MHSATYATRKLGTIALLVGLLTACSHMDGAGNAKPKAGTVKSSSQSSVDVSIYRDSYGTPHIFAGDNYGVYYGYGYAVAQDRLFQMEMLKRTAEGRVAEVLGDEHLELDQLIRTSYDHRAVRQQLAALNEEDRDVLQAYADGFTHRVDEVLSDKKTLLPAEFQFFDFLPEAWTAYDVAMIFVGAIAHRYSDFNSELDNLQLLNHLENKHGKEKAWAIFNASKWLLDDDSPTTVPRTGMQSATVTSTAATPRPDYLAKFNAAPATRRIALGERGEFLGTTTTPAIAAYFRKRIGDQGFSISPEFTPASNYWSANKMRDANAALVNGPQFGWSVPSYAYGVGLHGGDFNVVGNTLLALPTLLFAHNNHVGWGSTAGLSDQVDVFVERLNPTNSNQYWHQGEYKAFDAWPETINVRDAEPVKVTARRSVHGMVQSLDDENKRAYTRARAWEGGELQTLLAWINLAKEKTLDAVQQQVAAVTTNINFYNMDRDGNLGYTHGGRYPRRAAAQDSRLPTPGDGELDWQGYRPQSENPSVRNPQQGYIANWNNRPREDWISIDLWSYTWSRADRVSLIFNEIEARPELSVQELWDINRSVSFDDVSAPFLLPFLFAAWQDQQQPAAVASALKELQSWNLQWLVDSEGNYGPAPTLMETWLRGLLEMVFKDDIGDQFFHLYAATNNPNKQLGPSMGTGPGTKAMIRNLDQLSADGARSGYDFFNGNDHQAMLRDTFTHALETLQAEQGSDMQQWRIAAHPMQWQAFNFRGVPQALPSAAQELPAYMNRGSENNLFIARGGSIEAYDVMPPGQSGFIGADEKLSPHYADQMQMFSSFKYKPVPFERADIEKAAISVKRLNYSR